MQAVRKACKLLRTHKMHNFWEQVEGRRCDRPYSGIRPLASRGHLATCRCNSIASAYVNRPTWGDECHNATTHYSNVPDERSNTLKDTTDDNIRKQLLDGTKL